MMWSRAECWAAGTVEGYRDRIADLGKAEWRVLGKADLGKADLRKDFGFRESVPNTLVTLNVYPLHTLFP